MALKSLKYFFDIDRFLSGKVLKVKNVREWIENGATVGSKVYVVIDRDDTVYPEEVENALYEVLTLKVKGKNVSLPQQSIVTPVNPHASLYCHVNNNFPEINITIVCDDVKVVTQSKPRL